MLIPQYQTEGVRNKYINSLSFYESGALKKLALQEQSLVLTNSGSMKAELITFYESGKIKRLFPLNGKITGYWTEDNEYELAEPMELSFSFGTFNKRVIGILFYEAGEIKSITFWPKELVKLKTPAGTVVGHFGIALYPEGNLKSCEPAYPILVDTAIGKLTAFDMEAIGINGDSSSLNFYENGSIKSILTSTDRITVSCINKESLEFEPGLKPSLLDEEGVDIIPLKVEFYDGKVRINGNDKYVFGLQEYSFTVTNKPLRIYNKCGSCSECNGCN
jgi:antitoxin component YwqK of YwqJK toxin-antitoxin module